jgi:hypothetical protein
MHPINDEVARHVVVSEDVYEKCRQTMSVDRRPKEGERDHPLPNCDQVVVKETDKHTERVV